MGHLENLPQIFHTFPNWVVWREEALSDNRLTKVPYQATDSKMRAKSTSPETWNRLSAAVKKSLHMADPSYKSGVGFVISRESGLICIDLDNPDKLGGNAENARRLHAALLEEFSGTYIEVSPSGTGYHIWLWGILPENRLSVSLKSLAGIEIYSGQRFMTMTGDKVGIVGEVTNQQPILDRLIKYMSDLNGGRLPGAAAGFADDVDADSSLGRRNDLSDAEVLQIAIRSNTKFLEFYNSTPEHDRSQFAKPVAGDLDKICSSPEQILRIMLNSPIGRCYEARELERKVLGYWIPEARASNQQILELRAQGREMQRQIADAEDARLKELENAPNPERTEAFFTPPFKHAPQQISKYIDDYPPGFIGTMAQEIRERATMRASKDFAVAAALSLWAGMSGHAYSFEKVNGALYLLMLGQSGQGKEAPAEARDKLIQQLRGAGVHEDLVSGLLGPSKITSPQGLHRRLEKDKNLLCIIGEATLWLNNLVSSTHGMNPEVKQFVVDLYGKQGRGRVLSPSEVLGKDSKLNKVIGPAVTMLMEGEPSVYSDLLGIDQYTASGFCARIIHVDGDPADRPRKNYDDTSFSDYVIRNLAQVVGFWMKKKNDQNAMLAAQNNGVNPIGVDPESAWIRLKMTSDCLLWHREFDAEIDTFINSADQKVKDVHSRLIANVLRVAINIAAGVNPYDPVIDLDVYRWSQAFVLRGLHAVTSRVVRGETGTGDLRIRSIVTDKLEQWRNTPKAERLARLRDTGSIKNTARREALARYPGMSVTMLRRMLGPQISRHVNAERAGRTLEDVLRSMEGAGECTLAVGYEFEGELTKCTMVGWVDD